MDHAPVECLAKGCTKTTASNPPLFCETHAAGVKDEVWKFLQGRYKGEGEKQTKEFQSVVRHLIAKAMWTDQNDKSRTE